MRGEQSEKDQSQDKATSAVKSVGVEKVGQIWEVFNEVVKCLL